MQTWVTSLHFNMVIYAIVAYMRGMNRIDVNKIRIEFKRAIENSIKFYEHNKAHVKNNNND